MSEPGAPPAFEGYDRSGATSPLRARRSCGESLGRGGARPALEGHEQ